MAKVTYEQAYRDHQYLWTAYGPAADMSGGYVNQHDLEKLLSKPTKSVARRCLVSQIMYWFEVGPSIATEEAEPITWGDPIIREIADRYGVDHD